MKKLTNKISFALVGIMAAMPAFAADQDMCKLIGRLQSVFKILRTAALVGMAFYLASWAWTYISKGEAKVEDVKKQGIAVIVGVALLFMISVILTFVLNMPVTGENGVLCIKELEGGW